MQAADTEWEGTTFKTNDLGMQRSDGLMEVIMQECEGGPGTGAASTPIKEGACLIGLEYFW